MFQRTLTTMLLNLVLAFVATAYAQEKQNASAKMDAPTLYEKSVISVVLITSIDKMDNLGQGSGVIVRSDGIIATNFHVIKDAVSARVQLRNGDIYDDVSIIDVDERKDIAILKIKAVNLPALSFADSDKLKVGSSVFAVGAPRGLEGSLSSGIISSVRTGSEVSPKFEGFRVIQFTAPISPGSSGGPLIDEYGKVVGIVFAFRVDAQNLNLAIPSNYISGMVTQANSEGRRLGKMPAQIQAQPSLSAKPFVKRPIAEVLASAKTICVYQPARGNPTVKAKVNERLTQWGRLTLVSSPEEADIILEVAQVGEYNMNDHLGSYSSAMAILREPGSSAELWTVSKGSYWSMSGFSIAKVSTQIGDAFVKFFESTLKQANKNKK
ncbi:MAG: S1C family serine protease [Blastocatellia bacterium]